jgi:hypothetical protein
MDALKPRNPSPHVQFRISEDAGTITLDGAISNGTYSGAFHFQPNPSFETQSQNHLAEPPTPWELMEFCQGSRASLCRKYTWHR